MKLKDSVKAIQGLYNWKMVCVGFDTLMAIPVYFGGAAMNLPILVPQIINLAFSERIKSQCDLDRIVREESSCLGMDKLLFARFDNTITASSLFAWSKKCDDDTYEITVCRGPFASRTIVRHELYHIHKGHCGEQRSVKPGRLTRYVLNYWLRQEPQAVAYQFGIQI